MDLENEKCVMPNYENECRKLSKEVDCLKRQIDELQTINGYLERERDIYMAKYSAVELIFGKQV